MLSLPVPVLSCRPHRRCCGRRRSRTLETPRLPDETRPRLSSRRAPTRTPFSRPVPNSPPVATRLNPLSRHAPEPSSCVSPPTAAPLSPERDTRPTFLEHTQTEPSTERIQTEPSTERIQTEPSTERDTRPTLASRRRRRQPSPPPRPLWSSLSRSSLKPPCPPLADRLLPPPASTTESPSSLPAPSRPLLRLPQTIHSDARPGSPPIYQQTGSPTHRQPPPVPRSSSAPPAPLATRLPLSR
jgi:hypothetical protein